MISYWSMLLDRPVAEIIELIEGVADSVAAEGVPYVYVAGETPPDAVASWMRERIPQARTLVWENGGHFPHLAHPDRFAALLDSTGRWPNS